MPKFQISLFFEQLTLVETSQGVSINFVEQICCVLSEDMSFETFTPIWSHEKMKKKKKIAKILNLKFPNSLDNFGRDPP